jgi:predicted transcriptional regulator
MEKTTRPLRELGEKYGVTKQAISDFVQKMGIKRPERPKRDHTKRCPICKRLIRIAQKPNNEFISCVTISSRLGIGRKKLYYHIRLLRKKGLISPKFAKIRSERVERAYQILFKKKAPIRAISRQVGLKNFYSAMKHHRALGWDIPVSLLKNKNDSAYPEKNRIRNDKKRKEGRPQRFEDFLLEMF